MVPTLRLIHFEQKKGEEVPDFNTIYYDRERKRIVELQSLQVEKRSMEAAQESLQKVQQECQGLRAEKEQLLSRIGELEL